MASTPALPQARARAAVAALVVGLLASLLPAVSLASPAAGAADSYDSVIELTFPADPSKVSFGDWYHAARSGGRVHKATDIMGPKLLPIFAAMGGTVTRMTHSELSGYYLTIAGTDGRSYSYVHLNNDSPGTDDGAAPPEQAFAPGIAAGATVRRGQHIAWIGDSGNAEDTEPHLHFSISDPAITDPYETHYRDPYDSLHAAIDGGDIPQEAAAPLPAAPPPPATGPVPDFSGVCDDTVSTQSFSDVTSANVHRDAIECLARREVTYGTGDDRYTPGTQVTRLQMASFTARLLTSGGVRLPEPTADYFDDDTGSVHEEAVNQLVEIGVIRYDTGEKRAERDFEGEIAMKRDRMAAWMARTYALIAGHELPATSTDYFRDDSQYHHADINRLAEAGIVQGTKPGIYEPRSGVRRDQMASYLCRTLAAALA